jgi:hypothetical protein
MTEDCRTIRGDCDRGERLVGTAELPNLLDPGTGLAVGMA